MSRTEKNYAHNTQLSTSATDIVGAVPTAVVSVVSKLSFYNSSTTNNRQVTVYAVESGGTAGTGNILAKRSISPGQTWNVVEAITERLSAGMKLQAVQDAGTDVNANCSGADFSA